MPAHKISSYIGISYRLLQSYPCPYYLTGRYWQGVNFRPVPAITLPDL